MAGQRTSQVAVLVKSFKPKVDITNGNPSLQFIRDCLDTTNDLHSITTQCQIFCNGFLIPFLTLGTRYRVCPVIDHTANSGLLHESEVLIIGIGRQIIPRPTTKQSQSTFPVTISLEIFELSLSLFVGQIGISLGPQGYDWIYLRRPSCWNPAGK